MAEQDAGRLWADLDKHLSLGNYDAALHATSKLEKFHGHDSQLVLAKISCLINVGQYDSALKEMDAHLNLSDETVYQRAYCLYRVNKLDEAISLSDIEDEAFRVLKAQVLYKQDNYAGAASAFEDLREESNVEIATNHVASIACGFSTGQEVKADANVSFNHGANHELMFNLGCLALAKRDYVSAEKWIEEARDLCRKTLADEGFEEADIEEEMGQMNAQLALVHQRTGRLAEAKKQYEAILRSRPSDSLLTAIVSNNLASLQADKVYDMKQRMKAATGIAIESKMASFQRDVVKENLALMYFHDKQAEQCDAAVKSLEAENSTSVIPYIIQAATLAKSKQLKEAVDVLQKCTERIGGDMEAVSLAKAQLQMQLGDTEGAVKALLESEKLRYRPGVVSTVVDLLQAGMDSSNDEQKRRACLKAFHDAVQHAEKTAKETELHELLLGQASFLMAHDMHKDAADAYLKVVRADTTKTAALAGLVTAYSYFDLEKAELYAQQLPAVEGVLSTPVETLETVLPGRKLTSKKPSETVMSTDQKRRRKRKSRKGKLPKDKDALIDPERWLPKWQRSYNKKKYKKQQQAMRGPQGAAAPTAPSQTGSIGGLKGKGPANSVTPPPAETAQQTSTTGQSSQKNTNAKKAKRKGKF